MTAGALLAQLGHAVTECLRAGDVPLADDTRIVVLSATKEQLAALDVALTSAGVHHKAIIENEGQLKDVVTAIGLLTYDRDALRPLLGHLKPWREPKSAPQSIGEAVRAATPGGGE